MKANELMIGDWYAFRGHPYKCTASDIASIAECEEKGAPTDISEFPLTPEILEKNGFRKQKWNDLVTEFVFAKDLEQTPQTVIQFTFYSREIEGVKSLLRMWTKSQFGHGQNDVHLCGVYYIHELQHALRLCGIEKEIML